MSSDRSERRARTFRRASLAAVLTAGLLGDALAVSALLAGLGGDVDYAAGWGFVGVFTAILAMCIHLLLDPAAETRRVRRPPPLWHVALAGPDLRGRTAPRPGAGRGFR